MSEVPAIGRWVLAPHAATRMTERHIAVDDLEELLKKPDLAMAQGPKWILAKRFERREDNLIAAVVLQKGDID